MNVLPTLAPDDVANVLCAYTKLPRQFYVKSAIFGRQSYCPHIVWLENGPLFFWITAAPMIVPAGPGIAVFSVHIFSVIAIGSLEKMGWISTGRKIAFVADAKPYWVEPVSQKESDPVGKYRSFLAERVSRKMPVSLFRSRAFPRPTIPGWPVAWRFVNKIPKSVNISLRQRRKWFRFVSSHLISFQDHLVRAVEAFPRLAARSILAL